MTADEKKTCKAIVAHYGDMAQRPILCEECAELIQATIKTLRGTENANDNFIEELADVSIMVEQMVQSLSLYDLQIYHNTIRTKLNRQLERMQFERIETV